MKILVPIILVFICEYGFTQDFSKLSIDQLLDLKERIENILIEKGHSDSDLQNINRSGIVGYWHYNWFGVSDNIWKLNPDGTGIGWTSLEKRGNGLFYKNIEKPEYQFIWSLEHFDGKTGLLTIDGRSRYQFTVVGGGKALSVVMDPDVESVWRGTKLSFFRTVEPLGSGDSSVVPPTLTTTEVTAESKEIWDSILEAYEASADAVIVANSRSKRNAQDLIAIKELDIAYHKYISLQQRLQSSEKELTPQQIDQLEKITSKVSSAIK